MQADAWPPRPRLKRAPVRLALAGAPARAFTPWGTKAGPRSTRVRACSGARTQALATARCLPQTLDTHCLHQQPCLLPQPSGKGSGGKGAWRSGTCAWARGSVWLSCAGPSGARAAHVGSQGAPAPHPLLRAGCCRTSLAASRWAVVMGHDGRGARRRPGGVAGCSHCGV